MTIPISAVLKGARMRRGLTSSDVATLSGVPKSTISRLESGQRQPSFETVRRVLNSIGYEASDQLRPQVTDEQLFRFLEDSAAGLIRDEEAPDRLRIAAQTAPIIDRAGLRRVSAGLIEVLQFAGTNDCVVSGLEACSDETSFTPVVYMDPDISLPWDTLAFGQRGTYVLPLDDRKRDLVETVDGTQVMPIAWALMDAISSPGRQADVALDILDFYRKVPA